MSERRIAKGWKWIKRLLGLEPEQRTFCYCKNCRNELCSDPQTACYDAGNAEYHYICSKCGWQTDFFFDAPVPIYLRCYPPAGRVERGG